MKQACSEKSLQVLNYLKSLGPDENVTAEDIGNALGLEKKTVDGIVTAGLQRKGYSIRVPAEVEVTNENGDTVHQMVKFIKLTDEGKAYDHKSATEADIKAQMAAAD